MNMIGRFKSRDSARICYYKNQNSIRINDYKILDATQTISK